MSLIIKGMSLPHSCSTCRFSYFTVGIKKRCEISGDEVNPLIDKRETNCPLVEIPTPHGRLIDADKLVWFIDNHIAAGKKWVEFETIKDMINSLPTIIEAEVSE